MKTLNRILFIICLAYFALAASTFVQILHADRPFYPAQGRWDLVWDDDFNEPLLNETKWTIGDRNCNYDIYRKEIKAIGHRNIQIKNGYLMLACNDVSDQYPFTTRFVSGRVSNSPRYDWKYGRFEVRARLPAGQGLLSDIGLQSSGEKLSREILMRMLSGGDSYTILMDNSWGTNQLRHYLQEDECGKSFLNFPDNFHTYTIEWEPGVVRWYVDNINIYQTSENIPDSPLSLSLGCSAGNLYLYYMTSKLRGRTFILPSLPQYLIVDWVRVYQRR